MPILAGLWGKLLGYAAAVGAVILVLVKIRADGAKAREHEIVAKQLDGVLDAYRTAHETASSVAGADESELNRRLRYYYRSE